jgi:hypothetical protein
MPYYGKQVSLLLQASKLHDLGYNVGLAKKKALVRLYQTDLNHHAASNEGDWDGISIILDGVACVDFDMLDMDLGWHFLPPTWKERSPRGWHLFYRIPHGCGASLMTPKIRWRPDVDLLIKGTLEARKSTSAYGSSHPKHKTDTPFFGHVIVAPSEGYRRIWPDKSVPERDAELTEAPDWLCEALLKK